MGEHTAEQISKLAIHGENGIASVTSEPDGFVVITLKNGHTLNSFLPPEYKILNTPDELPSLDTRNHLSLVVRINEKNLSNTYYRAGVAHEFGHVLDPEAKNYHIAFGNKPFTIDFIGKEMPQKIAVLEEWFKTVLEMEWSAWEYGKPIGDVLDVDEHFYEEIMTKAIETYYHGIFNDLEYFIRTYLPDISENTELRLFNPYSREREKILYSDLKKKGDEYESARKKSFEALQHLTRGEVKSAYATVDSKLNLTID